LPPTRFPSLWTCVRGRSAWSVTWGCGLVRSSADALEPRRMRPELRPARPPSLKVFKSVCDRLAASASSWASSVPACYVAQDHPAYIPRSTLVLSRRRPARCRGWPASGPGRLPPGPCLLAGVSAEVSGVKCDFACTLAGHFPPVLIVLRSRSRLRREGRARTLSGPSPELRLIRTPALSVIRAGPLRRRRRG